MGLCLGIFWSRHAVWGESREKVLHIFQGFWASGLTGGSEGEMNFIGCCNSAWILLWKIFLVQNFEDCFLENHFQIFLFLKSRFENSFECMHRLREARQSLVSFTVNGCLCSTTIPYRKWKAWSLGLICLALSYELFEWALSSFISFELGWGFKHWSHSCLAGRPWCKVDGAFMRYDLLRVRDLNSIITSFWPKVHCYMTNRSPTINEVFVGL